jgi:hypothetical protein
VTEPVLAGWARNRASGRRRPPWPSSRSATCARAAGVSASSRAGERRRTQPPRRPPELTTGGAAASDAEILALVRDVPDFPTPGVLFKDITPLSATAARSPG